MKIDQLVRKANNSPVCLGLDTRTEYFPDIIKNQDISIEDKIFQFNKELIDQTLDLVACYKLQIACYEALGLKGLKAYSKTLKYLKDNGALTIGDIKRGDISSTAKDYAKAHFEGDFKADFLTLNPYMGEDAISPYYPYLRDKGIFALVHTSNPSSSDIQEEILESGEPVYEKMASLVNKWGEDFIGEEGYSSVGSVFGLTFPEDLKNIASNYPNMFFLIPGYGAQGGTAKDIATALGGKKRAVVNNSRGLITAHQKSKLPFGKATREATQRMKDDIFSWLS